MARYNTGATTYVKYLGWTRERCVDDLAFHQIAVAGRLVVQAGMLCGAGIVNRN